MGYACKFCALQISPQICFDLLRIFVGAPFEAVEQRGAGLRESQTSNVENERCIQLETSDAIVIIEVIILWKIAD